MGDESRLVWTPLKEQLVKRRWPHQRLEDKLTPGIPDVNLHVPDGPDVWVELKYVVDAPVIEVGLRPEQFIWLRDGARAGRVCYLLARVEATWCLWADERSWELAKHPCQREAMMHRANRFHHPDEILSFLADEHAVS